MSWTVDGHTYHSYGEYQAALARHQGRVAAEQSEQLRRQAEELGARVARRERELEQARGDYEAQVRINRALQSDVGDLRRTQEQLASLQEEMDRRMERSFADLREQARGQREDLAALEARHRGHVEEVRQTFAHARRDIERGLAQAEERRREGEARLRQAVAAVDEKLERDRAERLARHSDRLDQARVQADLAEELAAVAGRLAELDLEEEAAQLRLHVDQVRRLCAQGDGASALAVGHAAFADARALHHKVRARGAELDQTCESLRARIQDVRALLADKVTRAVFAVEVERADVVLGRLEQRVQQGYRSFRRLAAEALRDEDLVRRLQEQALVMAAAAPALLEQARQRNEQLLTIVAQLARAYGPLSRMEARLGDPRDPKSPLVGACSFGGIRVDVHLGLDGRVCVDAYGHESNGECARKAQAAVGALREAAMVGAPHVDQVDNRRRPALVPAAVEEQWQRVGERVADLDRSST